MDGGGRDKGSVLQPPRSFKSQVSEWLGISSEHVEEEISCQSLSGDHTVMDASLGFILCLLVPGEWGYTRGWRAGQYLVPSSPHPEAIKALPCSEPL